MERFTIFRSQYESLKCCTPEIRLELADAMFAYAFDGKEPVFKDKMSDGIGAYPIDAKYHIYDPINETERVVKALTSNSGYCVARTKHGRFCDIVASKFANDNSRFATHYADGQFYTASRCRFVGRSYYDASAHGGVVYSSPNYASSYSSTNIGSRLAFRGIIFISE